MTVTTKTQQRLRRRKRVRSKISGSPERPRLSVFRSNRGVFAQLIDDRSGKTVAAVSWIEPDLRMNPILVKPEGENRSQLVVLGKVDRQLSRTSWLERPPSLWPVAEAALRELLDEYDLVLLEGAGSPAETNLRASDLANMRAARAASAPVVLVADIDRGGAFAHLHGTWSLVTDDDRFVDQTRHQIHNLLTGDVAGAYSLHRIQLETSGEHAQLGP